MITQKHICNIVPWISWKTYCLGKNLETLLYNQRLDNYYLLDNNASHNWNKLFAEHFIEDSGIPSLSLLFNENIISSDFQPLYDTTFCSIIKSDTIPSDFSARIKQQGYVFDVHWDLTNKCNAKCIHCYNAHSQDGTRNIGGNNELLYEEAISMVNEIDNLGVFRLVLSGGEVLTKNYFILLCEYIRKKNISLIIYTNSILLNKENIANLSKLYPTSICISVYGPNSKIHDQITQVNGSYEKILNSLSVLKKEQIRTCLKNTLLSLNYKVWEETYRKGFEISDNSMINLTIYPSMDDGNLTKYALNENQLLDLAIQIDSPIYYRKRKTSVCSINKSLEKSPCYDETNQIYISPNGDIFPCIAFPCKIASLREGNIRLLKRYQLSDKFHDDFSRLSYTERLDNWRSLKIKDLRECGKYEYCHFCIDVCPGDALLMHGDCLATPDNHCVIAKARYQASQMNSNKRRN